MSAVPGAVAPRAARRHLYEIDVLRILTFACVIAVHSIDHTVRPTDLPMTLVLGLAHFTREVFFALSAFVLVYSYNHKPQPMRRFWPRRFLLVGVPYVAWSIIYEVYNWVVHPGPTVLELIGRTARALVNGTGGYHLYFLLVTMQVYLLLPLVIWLVRRTRGHHRALLGIALVAQLIVLAVWEYVPGASANSHNFDNAGFWSYSFMIIAGAVVADHATVFLAWIRGNGRTVAAITLGTAVLTVAVFLAQLAAGFSYRHAVTALQPVIVLWATAVGLAFVAIGARWAARRRSGSLVARGVDTASDISFGVFLVHPLVIYLVILVGGDALLSIADPWLQLVVYCIVVVVSIAFSFVVRRTPASLPLTGRPWVRRAAASPRKPVRPESESASAA